MDLPSPVDPIRNSATEKSTGEEIQKEKGEKWRNSLLLNPFSYGSPFSC
jgi:hypothetical protein